jgi:hypothetical protein
MTSRIPAAPAGSRSFGARHAQFKAVRTKMSINTKKGKYIDQTEKTCELNSPDMLPGSAG